MQELFGAKTEAAYNAFEVAVNMVARDSHRMISVDSILVSCMVRVATSCIVCREQGTIVAAIELDVSMGDTLACNQELQALRATGLIHNLPPRDSRCNSQLAAGSFSELPRCDTGI